VSFGANATEIPQGVRCTSDSDLGPAQARGIDDQTA